MVLMAVGPLWVMKTLENEGHFFESHCSNANKIENEKLRGMRK